MALAAKGAKSKTTTTFTIDCTKPVEDKIMDIAQFEKFLLDRIKVDGKTGVQNQCLPETVNCTYSLYLKPSRCVAGVLGDSVKITKDKTKLSVSTDVPMSKRCAHYQAAVHAWCVGPNCANWLLDVLKCCDGPARCCLVIALAAVFLQVSQVLDEEIPQETQCPGLAAGDCFQQGQEVRIMSALPCNLSADRVSHVCDLGPLPLHCADKL